MKLLDKQGDKYNDFEVGKSRFLEFFLSNFYGKGKVMNDFFGIINPKNAIDKSEIAAKIASLGKGDVLIFGENDIFKIENYEAEYILVGDNFSNWQKVIFQYNNGYFLFESFDDILGGNIYLKTYDYGNVIVTDPCMCEILDLFIVLESEYSKIDITAKERLKAKLQPIKEKLQVLFNEILA